MSGGVPDLVIQMSMPLSAPAESPDVEILTLRTTVLDDSPARYRVKC